MTYEIRDSVFILKEFLSDFFDYRAARTRKFRGGRGLPHWELETHLTKDYHRVEKGLALQDPRRPFGRDVERRLDSMLKTARTSDNSSEPAYAGYAVEALEALRAWNKDGVRSDALSPQFRSGVASGIPEPVRQFFESRVSVRDFDRDRVVSREVLSSIVSLAQNAPSVCNRQSGRLHVYNGSAVERVLQNQNGNAGFRSSVPHVAIVTANRRLFVGPEERNQRWIDGGLYAMTVVWAMHSLGVGSCMLNWSVKNEQSKRMRQVADIPMYEDIICLIAFGYRRTDSRVARSPRRSSDEVVTFHE